MRSSLSAGILSRNRSENDSGWVMCGRRQGDVAVVHGQLSAVEQARADEGPAADDSLALSWATWRAPVSRGEWTAGEVINWVQAVNCGDLDGSSTVLGRRGFSVCRSVGAANSAIPVRGSAPTAVG
jgi:hypothetical protein